MSAQTLIDLIDGRFGGGHLAQRVQSYEIVNRAVVANRIDRYARLLELSGVGLAFVAQRIILRGDDERRRQAPSVGRGWRAAARHRDCRGSWRRERRDPSRIS